MDQLIAEMKRSPILRVLILIGVVIGIKAFLTSSVSGGISCFVFATLLFAMIVQRSRRNKTAS